MKTQRTLLARFIPILVALLLPACSEKPTISKNRESGQVTVIPNVLTLYEGRYDELRGQRYGYGVSLVWTSSNYAVVDVWSTQSNGFLWFNCCGETATVKALKPGTARIYGDLVYPGPKEWTGYCDVTVLPVTAQSIDIQPDTLTLAVGSSRWISIFVYDSVGVSLNPWPKILSWYSSDPTVASVGADEWLGLRWIYGRNQGQTYVIASTDGGLSDSSLVIVE